MKRAAIKCVILISLILATNASADNDITNFREFFVDPPTLECLGFRWYIDGDDNSDATVQLNYRKAGVSAWNDALPMLRVNREETNKDYSPFTCENLFAGSILNLEPGTEYEVSFLLRDPDGASADTTLTVSTRAVPEAPEPLRTLHVYPADFAGDNADYKGLYRALTDVKAGDLVLIHGGEYTVPSTSMSLQILRSGTEENPIVFRGAGDGEVVVASDRRVRIFDVTGADHLFFEGITIRGGKYGIYSADSSWLTVRNCKIERQEINGIQTMSELSEGWYIADNEIIGANIDWYPRKEENPSYTGVNLYGRGHIVCYNRIANWWDCIAIYDYDVPVSDLSLQCTAIDFYNNDLSEAVDDGIESDYGCHNIRIYNNRIRNAHTGLSAQPTYGGPIYFIGNEVYNITSLPLKLHNYCTGLEIYHNTLVSANQAFDSVDIWQNATLRNNLFLGATRYCLETGSPDPRTTLDYNGYFKVSEDRFIKWNGERYLTLEAFQAGTGFEEHGIMVDYSSFAGADIAIEGQTYSTDDFNLTLASSAAAIDAGLVLPTVNDSFVGNAPDMGCHEYGAKATHYGPRNDISTSVNGRASLNPDSFHLDQNSPNPFNSSTMIRFSLTTQSHVTLTVFNLLGQPVRTLVEDVKSNGSYSILWDGKDDSGSALSTGMYIYSLTTAHSSVAKKLLLLN